MTTPSPLPVVYIPHGGGPWAFVEVGFSKAESDALKAYLRSVRTVPETPPKALLVISAHWEEGFDHGTFIPLKVAYPDADVPTIQLSLKTGLDPAEHLAIGRTLAPLRDEGVFIVGSGMSFHNMRAFGSGSVGRPKPLSTQGWWKGIERQGVPPNDSIQDGNVHVRRNDAGRGESERAQAQAQTRSIPELSRPSVRLPMS